MTYGNPTGPRMCEADAHELPALSLLIRRGPFGTDPHVDGPGRRRLKVGDRWPCDTPQGGMTAHLDASPARLSVCLAMRFDEFDDGTWEAFGALPIVAGFLATSPIGWFVTDASGLHMRAAVAMGRDPEQAAQIRRYHESDGVRRTLTMFGIGGGTVRSIHVGVTLDRLWELLQEGFGEVMTPPPEQDYLDVLATLADVPAGVMFAGAIARHLHLAAGPSGVATSAPVHDQARRCGSARRSPTRR